MPYQPPQWSRPPPPQWTWSVDEIKSGVLVATHSLRGACTTFGRAADQVTVPTAHESCSRVHARIAFDSSGTPWLRDLGSGNGTTVNGRSLPPKSVGRDEFRDGRGEGSRGVVVYPGDAVRFGASTRVFCLNGPEEFDRGAVKARLEQAKANGSAVKTAASAAAAAAVGKDAAPEEEGGGVSWGMDMTDPAENDATATADNDRRDDAKWSTRPIQEADVPEKHRKLYERLRAKRYKLDNVRVETERIEAKGAFGDLTEGQTARIELNKRKEEELRGQIEEVERELREKIWGSKGSDRATRKRTMERGDDTYGGEDDDVDDFYDRTADARKKSRQSSRDEEEGETEQSLTAKWKDLIASLRKRKGDAAVLKRRVDNLRAKIISTDEADEDAFFLKNDLEIAQDNFDKAASGITAVEDELTSTEKLLRVVNDKLFFDRSVSFVGLESDHPKSKKVEDSSTRSKASATDAGTMMPPPSRAVAGPSVTPGSGVDMMPPPPRPKVPAGPMPPPSIGSKKGLSEIPASTTATGSIVPVAPAKSIRSSRPVAPPPKRRAVGPAAPPPGGTLAAIQSAASGPSRAKTAVTKVKGPKPASVGAGGAFNNKEDTWKAPEGQDGSGMTKLNAKFAGRY